MKPAVENYWSRHAGLVWSNPGADDAVHMRAALLKPRFDRLLDIAVEFGTDRLRAEWRVLLEESSPETIRVQPIVERILAHIEKGFELAAAAH